MTESLREKFRFSTELRLWMTRTRRTRYKGIGVRAVGSSYESRHPLRTGQDSGIFEMIHE